MAIYWNNDTLLQTEQLTSSSGGILTTQSVAYSLFSENRSTTYLGPTAMTHSSSGYWIATVQSSEVGTISASVRNVWVRVDVRNATSSGEIDASFERIEPLLYRAT